MRIILFLFLSFLIISCSDTDMKFNSDKWKPVENGLYGANYRKEMVNDLVRNVLKFNQRHEKGTEKNQVYKLIGTPDEKDSVNHTITYWIEEKFDYSIDPNGYVVLELTLDPETETLEKWKIIETRYEP